MRYFPQGPDDIARMLDAVGVGSVDALFECIPRNLRLNKLLDVPPPHSEMDLRRELGALASGNATAASHRWFLGAGAYNHYVPAAIGQILLRSEFYTSYTPYQPEISQGTLQAIFEFQTLMAALTELDVANASLYDGASATAEGVLVASRATRRRRIHLSEALHPLYARVVRTYVRHLGMEVATIPVLPDGRTDLEAMKKQCDAESAVVVLQNPNFFGCVEDLETAVPAIRASGAFAQVVITEALSLGLLHGPGRWGADLAVGEAHSLGTPPQFGGPVLGFMVAREGLLRQMPGRLVGEARDADGRPAYVMTLVTREQHIRREKATSNICTNQGLIALGATIYMSLMGREGMREVALQNRAKALWAKERLSAIPGFSVRFTAPVFNEFVIDMPRDASEVSEALISHGVVGGLPLGTFYAGMERSMLFCVTEMNSRGDIETLASALEECAS